MNLLHRVYYLLSFYRGASSKIRQMSEGKKIDTVETKLPLEIKRRNCSER
jgi:hypothetical protein